MKIIECLSTTYMYTHFSTTAIQRKQNKKNINVIFDN